MPATGLKIVGTGHVYPGVASHLFKTVWRRLCIEVMSFWSCWNLVPLLPDIGFQLLKSSWSSLTYFSFNDAPNVLYRWKIWTTGQFSTRTLLLQSHAVVMAVVCGFTLSCWNTHNLEGDAYVALKPLYTFQHSECLPKRASCPYCMHLCTPIPSEMLVLNWTLRTHWRVSLLFSPEDTVSLW